MPSIIGRFISTDKIIWTVFSNGICCTPDMGDYHSSGIRQKDGMWDFNVLMYTADIQTAEDIWHNYSKRIATLIET